MKVTLIFPGQGSQYVGMGKNLTELPECKEVFENADSAFDFSITGLMFEGPEDKLKLTEFTQPSIVTHSYALFKGLKSFLDKEGIEVERVLGHSVGEYAALAATGAIDFKDAVKAVQLRGKYMQEAVAPGDGKMYAILRVPKEEVQKACEAVSTEEEKVMPANFNEPGQTVISGHSEACDKAVAWLKENYEGKQMAIPLKVSAPFHSSLMKPAEEKLSAHLESIEFKSNEIPYVANIDAKEYSKGTDGKLIKDNLVKQVCGSVLWSQSIEKLPEDTVFIEVGPGKVLTGLNKKINKNFKTYTLDSEAGFEGLKEFLA